MQDHITDKLPYENSDEISKKTGTLQNIFLF
jgi:hypothetical protein